LAKHEGEFQAAAEVSLQLGELLAALAQRSASEGSDRQAAIACYLSGAEGWRDAAARLKGAFAPAARLTDDKDA
jgi:hypothetical protein